MTSKYLAILLVIGGLLIGGGLLFRQQTQVPDPLPRAMEAPIETPKTDKAEGGYDFANPKKSAHYESNAPEHGSVLAGVPINVVINFNFDLAAPSEIDIIGDDGYHYAVGGGARIDNNKLTLRESMDRSAPDGKYTVKYLACWPDKSCHDGSFQFAIDRSKGRSLNEPAEKDEVRIAMKNIAYVPKAIRVRAGTTVTWINDDIVDHYVNTDPHPHHTYFLDQNSKLLKKGETYSVTFAEPGVYPYHCSAHTEMTGTILVE